MIFSVFMETDAHTLWADTKVPAENFKRMDLRKDLLSLLSFWRGLSSGPCAGGREKRSSEPWIEDVLALLHHKGRRTFALQVLPSWRRRSRLNLSRRDGDE